MHEATPPGRAQHARYASGRRGQQELRKAFRDGAKTAHPDGGGSRRGLRRDLPLPAAHAGGAYRIRRAEGWGSAKRLAICAPPR